MTRILLLLFLLYTCTTANAQSYNDDNWGADISRTERRQQQLYQGMEFGTFKGITTNGRVLTNDTLRGKVTLILFWYPSINMSRMRYLSDFLKLGTVASLGGQYKDF